MWGEREAAAAGRFYPGDEIECARAADALFEGVEVRAAVGAIVPHAGWVYSGRTAALGVAGVAGSRPDTVVVFGAVHVPTVNEASVYAQGGWRTPVGLVKIDGELAERVGRSRHVVADAGPHRYEHAIEVELPLVQRLLPEALIVPIMVGPGPWAEEVGRECARAAADLGRRVAFLGSTDLTHYGPAFGFEPHGHGAAGIRWAKEVNDRRFVRLIERMDAGALVPEARRNRNACGAGAVAATVGAMCELGCERYEELEHRTSAEVERGDGGQAVNSVGYEAGVFVEAG